MSLASVRDRPNTMSCLRLIGRASLATHLCALASSRHDTLGEAHSSRTEAGRHGGVLCAGAVCRCRRGVTAQRPAAIASRKDDGLFCEQDRSMPAIPCAVGRRSREEGKEMDKEKTKLSRYSIHHLFLGGLLSHSERCCCVCWLS